jgi:hypothetical protein
MTAFETRSGRLPIGRISEQFLAIVNIGKKSTLGHLQNICTHQPITALQESTRDKRLYRRVLVTK